MTEQRSAGWGAALSIVPLLLLGAGARAAGDAPPSRPSCDAACVRASTERAVLACAPMIEAQAPLDFDWLHRPLPGIFQQAEQPPAGGAVIQFRGDLIRFQTDDRDWVRMSYECGYDAGARKVVSIALHPGRLALPKPAVATDVDLPRARLPLARREAQPAGQGPGQTPVPVQAASAAEAGQQRKKPPPRVGEASPIAITQQVPRIRP